MKIDQYDSGIQDNEKDKLLRLNIGAIINYIKQSIEILMNMKIDEPSKRKKLPKMSDEIRSARERNDMVSEYEKIIQKLEADC